MSLRKLFYASVLPSGVKIRDLKFHRKENGDRNTFQTRRAYSISISLGGISIILPADLVEQSISR